MVRRREVLALAAIAVVSPGFAWPPPAPKRLREPWPAFRAGPDYMPFVKAIKKLKASTDPASPDSWAYWANIHQDHCPHGKPYFLAWHRGYLALFEAKLQQVARRDSLRIPYGIISPTPRSPAEFTAGDVSSNPLYEPRIGTNVAKAIDYGPFAAAVTRFDRGAGHRVRGADRNDPAQPRPQSDRRHDGDPALAARSLVLAPPRQCRPAVDRLARRWPGAGRCLGRPCPIGRATSIMVRARRCPARGRSRSRGSAMITPTSNCPGRAPPSARGAVRGRRCREPAGRRRRRRCRNWRRPR
ncbi:MAG: tyrosinase family protein [Sphingomonas sp.]